MIRELSFFCDLHFPFTVYVDGTLCAKSCRLEIWQIQLMKN